LGGGGNLGEGTRGSIQGGTAGSRGKKNQKVKKRTRHSAQRESVRDLEGEGPVKLGKGNRRFNYGRCHRVKISRIHDIMNVPDKEREGEVRLGAPKTRVEEEGSQLRTVQKQQQKWKHGGKRFQRRVYRPTLIFGKGPEEKKASEGGKSKDFQSRWVGKGALRIVIKVNQGGSRFGKSGGNIGWSEVS